MNKKVGGSVENRTNILVINTGSSSIKYQMFVGKDNKIKETIAEGIIERIGEKKSCIKHSDEKRKIKRDTPIKNHKNGMELLIDTLVEEEVIERTEDISAVGHRVVHGGDAFSESTLITDKVIEKIEEFIPLAPLHNPPNLIGIEEARKALPDISHIAVFDTSFHQTLPEKAKTYALPLEYYSQGVKKYGFHGTSYRYVCKRLEEIGDKSLKKRKIIICHLGNGASITAVDKGVSVDTSMGLTPLEGLVMGTRSGDIDPGIIFFLHRKFDLAIDEIDELLNNESGLLGLSGVSKDMREILSKANKGDDRCKLALELFSYRVKKYIGAYSTVLENFDTLIFTGGIGENAPKVRSMICQGLDYLGVSLNEKKNLEIKGREDVISSRKSDIKVLVIPTNEERMIARDTLKIYNKQKKNSGENSCNEEKPHHSQ